MLAADKVRSLATILAPSDPDGYMSAQSPSLPSHQMEISPFLWGEFQASSDGRQHDQQLPEPHGLTLGGDQHLFWASYGFPRR